MGKSRATYIMPRPKNPGQKLHGQKITESALFLWDPASGGSWGATKLYTQVRYAKPVTPALHRRVLMCHSCVKIMKTIKAIWSHCSPRKRPRKIKFGILSSSWTGPRSSRVSGRQNADGPRRRTGWRYTSKSCSSGARPLPFCLSLRRTPVENVKNMN